MQRAMLYRWSKMKPCNKREKKLALNISQGSFTINYGPEIKVTHAALVGITGS